MEDIKMSQMEITEIDAYRHWEYEAYRHWEYYKRILWQEFEQSKMFKVLEDTN